MNARPLASFLTAVLFLLAGSFATVAAAADKQYHIDVSPTTSNASPAASPATFVFTFTNDGNSSFNSLTLSLPTGWVVASGYTPSSSRGTATLNTARNVVTVNAINLPNGAGQSMTVTVSGVLGTGTCTGGPAAGDWSAQPWTGTPVGSGQTFSLSPGKKFPKTYVQPACFTVTASSSDTATGTVSPLTQTVALNATATVNLSPALHYHAVSATGCSGTLVGNTYTTGPITGNCAVVATFGLDTFTVTPSPGANGSMSPATAQTVGYGLTTSFGVTADGGYHIATISGCGTSLPGTNLVTTSVTTGAITGACTVSSTFARNTLSITAPDYAVINKDINVVVGINGPTPVGINLTSNCTLTGTTSKTAAAGDTSVTFTVKVASEGSCTFTANATDYAYASASTTTSIPIYTGTLGCEEPLNKYGALPVNTEPPQAYIGTPGWGLERSQINKDGVNCQTAVPFTFSFNPDATPQTASFIIPPNNLNQAVAAEYVLLWKGVPVNTTGTDAGWSTAPYGRPKLAWVKDGDGAFVYTPALWCVEDALGLLGAAVLPPIPNVEPFITLGATYPELAPTTTGNGNLAKMCVAQAGATAIGRSTVLPGNPILIQYWHKIIDYGDGAVNWGAD